MLEDGRAPAVAAAGRAVGAGADAHRRPLRPLARRARRDRAPAAARPAASTRYDGDAWLGLVPFRLANLRLRGLPPVPRLTFEQLDIRTYVTLDDRPASGSARSTSRTRCCSRRRSARTGCRPTARGCRPGATATTCTFEATRDGLSFARALPPGRRAVHRRARLARALPDRALLHLHRRRRPALPRRAAPRAVAAAARRRDDRVEHARAGRARRRAARCCTPRRRTCSSGRWRSSEPAAADRARLGRRRGRARRAEAHRRPRLAQPRPHLRGDPLGHRPRRRAAHVLRRRRRRRSRPTRATSTGTARPSTWPRSPRPRSSPPRASSSACARSSGWPARGKHTVDVTWWVLAVDAARDRDRREPDDRLAGARRGATRAPRSRRTRCTSAATSPGSVAVLVGLLIARAGYPNGDSVAALFVAVLVLVAAARLIRSNIDVLMDRAPDRGRGGRAGRDRGGDAGGRAAPAAHAPGRRPPVRRRRDRRLVDRRGRPGPRRRRRGRGGGRASAAGQRRRRARRAARRSGRPRARARRGADRARRARDPQPRARRRRRPARALAAPQAARAT